MMKLVCCLPALPRPPTNARIRSSADHFLWHFFWVKFCSIFCGTILRICLALFTSSPPALHTNARIRSSIEHFFAALNSVFFFLWNYFENFLTLFTSSPPVPLQMPESEAADFSLGLACLLQSPYKSCDIRIPY